MTDDSPHTATCPGCGRPVAASASFCESCGHTLVPTEAPPPTAPPSGSAQTRRLGTRTSEAATCASCGGTIGADGYCQTCGAKAPSQADHYVKAPAPWVGGACDRGRSHPRNEDAMALWAGNGTAVLVVCDGVSTSIDSDIAARIAATTARDVLVAALAGPDPSAAVAAGFGEATRAANEKITAITPAESSNAASATFAAGVVLGDELHYANLGDSRVYFLGDDALLLSRDDSMAQAFIEQGMTRAEAEKLPRAHAITRWLGRDATEIEPRTGVLTPSGPGWLVVCSDGLWNYASAPEQLAEQLRAAGDGTPVELAERLVAWANSCGGKDNITVALARVEPSAHSLGTASTSDEEQHPNG